MPAKFMISVALVLSIVQAQQCISLASSQQCADYKSFSILSFPGVANAGDFDKYVQSQAAFNFPQCSSWSNVASTPIRYSATFVCGWAVYYSTQLASGTKCNTGGGSVPTTICQASAAAALADVKSNLDKNCPSVQIYSQYNQFVSQINNTNCMLGIGKDQSMKCGFSSASESSDYCSKNANALCCTSTNNLVGSAPSNPTPSSSAAAPGSSTSATPSIDPSAPVNATTSLPNTAPPGNAVSPLLIGAAALGVALVAVLGAVLYFMTKKGKGEDAEAEFHGSVADDMKRGSVMPNTMSMSNANNAPVETMECIFEYKANLFDELTLEVGDEVEVLNKFDDGWALGHNLTSGKEGTFPLACLAPFGASSEYRDSRFESQYSKRDSSIRYTVDSSTFNKPY